MSENSILDNIKYNKSSGRLSYKDTRYLLIRPETIQECQKAMQKHLGGKTKKIFYEAGFKGGYLSAKKYQEVFNYSDSQLIEFIIKMGTEIGWGHFSLNCFNADKRVLNICVKHSPFILPGEQSDQHASYIIMGVIGGLATVVFGQHCPYSKVKCDFQGPDKNNFIVDLGLQPSGIAEAAFKILEGKRILAVDDEMDILDSIEEMLESSIVEKAVDFETARHLLRTQSYDAVILDIMGVDGYELLKISKNKKIPILMLTANALDSNNFAKSIKNGAHAYMPKENLFEIQTFLTDILSDSLGGRHKNSKWFIRLEKYFNEKYGSDWKDSIDPKFWENNFYN